LHSFAFAFGLACAAAKKLKNKKCAVAKNKTSLCWLSERAVSPSSLFLKNVRFMSVSLMLVRYPAVSHNI